ncbi:MAG TPA: TonB family protein [Candidatus Sulfotelmatobacter sp.]|nr:TonB family protein [Candidatus Sulfotelmatobacter sp.]
MAADAHIQGWRGPSRRRVPRFRMDTPLDVTVLRSGIPDTVPGRAVNVCERGIAAVLAGELTPGESVGLELQLWAATEPLRTKATVRYQENLRHGLEFVSISPEQRSSIRNWAKEAKAETEISVTPAVERGPRRDDRAPTARPISGGGGPPGKIGKKRSGTVWVIILLLLAAAAGFFWWKWNRGWEELESGLKSSDTVAAQKPQVQVPAEVMQKLLVHRVEPVYPPEARKQKLQGIIAVDIVVGRDGSVVSMRAVNGPDVLARAAMDALRWWKFEPYRVNGEPAVVETTMAVEFKS